MASTKLDAIEKAYAEAGFKTIRKGTGRLTFSKKAELIVIGRKGVGTATGALAKFLFDRGECGVRDHKADKFRHVSFR